MVDSRFGRTDRAEVGERRAQPRRLAEPQDREMRQPPPPLRLVHVKRLQAAVEVARNARGAAVLVVEDEHPDAPRLAVPANVEHGPRGADSRAAQTGCDVTEPPRACVAEKRERDVDVLARHDPHVVDAGEDGPLPHGEPLENVVSDPQGAEQPDPFIRNEATREGHAASSRLCVRRRRTRWRAATAARRRIACRSAWATKSTATESSGLDACRNTRPTGFSALPPPGPAIPVAEIPTSALSRSRMPCAIASAASAETAPWSRSTAGETPSSRVLISSEYAITPPTKASLEPGTDVSIAPTRPPVQDSAVASLKPRSRQKSITISCTGRSSSANRCPASSRFSAPASASPPPTRSTCTS